MADVTTNVIIELEARVDAAIAEFEKMATQIESQFAQLESTVSGHFDGMKAKATETADHMEKEGHRAGEGFRTGIEVALGALGLTFILSLRKAFEQGMQMTEQFKVLSAITGDAPGRLMQFQYALTQLGIPAQNLQLILAQLRTRIAAAGMQATVTKGVFHELGIDVKSLGGKDAITQIEAIADKIKNLRQDQQSRAVTQLFGFRGAAMLPLLDQGAEGVKRLVAAFKPPDPAVFEAFDRLSMASAALGKTWLSFSMEILTPLIEKFTVLVQHVTDFINKLRAMPEETKMLGLVASVAAAALGFETLTKLIGSFLVQSSLLRGFIVVLQSFAVPLEILAGLVIATALAWKSNWGDIRGFLQTLFADVQKHATDFQAAWASVVNYAKSTLIPAFDSLGAAVQRLLDSIGNTANNVLNSQTAWNALVVAMDAAVNVITALVGILQWCIDHFTTLAAIIGGTLAIVAIPKLLGMLVAMQRALQFNVAWAVLFGETAVTAFTTSMVAGRGLIGALWDMGKALIGVGAAEDIAFPWMIVIQVVIAALIGLWWALSSNIFHCRDAIVAILDALANLEQRFSDWVRSLPPVVQLILRIANGFQDMADSAKNAADQTRGLADAINNGPSGPLLHDYHAKQGALDAVFGKQPTKKADTGGTQTLAPDEDKGALAKWLDALKDWLSGFDTAVEVAQFQIDKLAAHIKLLGTIDSPAKLQQALNDIAGEAVLTGNEIVALVAKLRALEKVHADATARLAGTTDVKERHTLTDFIRGNERDQRKTELDITAQYQKRVDLNKEAYDTRKAFTDLIAGDPSIAWSSYKARVVDALGNVISDGAKDTVSRLGALHKQFLDDVKAGPGKVDWEKTDADLRAWVDGLNSASESAKKFSESVAGLATANSRYYAALAKAPGGGGEAGANAALAVQYAATAAQMALTRSVIEESNARGELNTYVQGEITAGHELDKHSDYYLGLLERINSAMGDHLTAQTAATQAYRDQVAQWHSVENAIFSQLDKLAQQVGGPLYSAFMAVTAYVNGDMKGAFGNLTSAVIAVFQKTLAYKDIQVFVMEATRAFAQILNALRPVLDFFLGVLIGIVNVFISMYDVLAMILDAFGFMIQKIKLLNSDLQNMSAAAQPLIKIVHDLPTISEYNKGMWTQLIGEQNAANNNLSDLNNDVLQGFDKTMSKLGEIVGILIAIKVILGLVMGQSLASQFGSGGFFGNIINAVRSWFGAAPNAAPGAPGGAAAGLGYGGVGNADSPDGSVSNPVHTDDAGTQAQIAQHMTATTSLAEKTATQATGNTSTLAATVGKVSAGIGGLFGLWQGFQTGGVMGGVEAGMGVMSLLSAVAPAFGPWGMAVGAGVGLLAMLLGGNRANPANEPDIYNTSAWGQENANLWGAGVGQFANTPMNANGQQFTMNPNLASATGGMGMLQYIAAFMQSGAGLNVLGPLASIFQGLSTTSTDIIGGKNGILYLMNGVKMGFADLYTNATQAMKEIQAYLQKTVVGTQEFAGAMNVAGSYARNFWNQSTRVGAGGGGAGGTMSPMTQTTQMNVNFNGDNYGLADEKVYNALKPVFDRLLTEYQTNMVLFTRSNNYAFTRGLTG